MFPPNTTGGVGGVTDDSYRHPVRVSVVIPFYNSSETVGRALESVRQQTLAPYEIIIVDDHSTPDQQAFLHSLVAGSFCPPVRILRQEANRGPAAARNLGWAEAQGDWITFLDSDDSWHPQRLEFQCNAISPETLLISTDTSVLLNTEKPPTEVIYDLPTIASVGLVRHLVQNPHATSSVLIRRSVPVRFTSGRFYSEDYELWIRVAALGEVLKVRAPLVYFHKHAFGTQGLSSNIWKMIAGEQLTFSLLRRDHVISTPQFLFAEVIMIARIVRRLIIRAVRGMRRA